MKQMAKLNSRKKQKKICFMRKKVWQDDLQKCNGQTYYNRAVKIDILSLICEKNNLVSSFTHNNVSLSKKGGQNVSFLLAFFIYDLNDFASR